MFNELLKLSSDAGVGYFLLYQSQYHHQKALEYVESLNNQQLSQLLSLVKNIEYRVDTKNISLAEINKMNKSKGQIISNVKRCIKILQNELNKRSEINKNVERQKRNKNPIKMRTIFDAVQLIVVGTLGILLALSLFSTNQWSEQPTAVQKEQVTSGFKSQNTDLPPSSLSLKEKIVNQQYKKTPIELFDEKVQQDLIVSQSEQKSQEIVFSEFEMVQLPLGFTYKLLLKILPQNVAYFICSYVLFFVYWILAILLQLAQLLG